MAANSIFIDTNVLVFATIPASAFHAAAITALHRVALAKDDAWVSRQVLWEYLVLLTRPGVGSKSISWVASSGSDYFQMGT